MRRRNPAPETFEGDLPPDLELLQKAKAVIDSLLFGDSSDPISWDGIVRDAKEFRSKLYKRCESN